MSRPKKDGLDYFPHDCDASHDEKIEAICALYGKHVGYSIVFRLYERIYRAGGSLNVSAAETMQILSRNYAEMDTETFKKFISSCLNLGIFDKNEYENNHLLTSDGIKRRVKPIIYKREKMAKMYQNQVSASETLPETTQETISETPQSKVKESKVKEKKLLFEKFWQLYPLRNGKKLLKADAEEFFVKEIKDEEFDLLLKAVGNYAVSRTVTDGYVKDAIRFLRKDYWKSWIEAEIPSHKKETPLKCAYDNNRPCYKDCKDCDIAKKKTA